MDGGRHCATVIGKVSRFLRDPEKVSYAIPEIYIIFKIGYFHIIILPGKIVLFHSMYASSFAGQARDSGKKTFLGDLKPYAVSATKTMIYR